MHHNNIIDNSNKINNKKDSMDSQILSVAMPSSSPSSPSFPSFLPAGAAVPRYQQTETEAHKEAVARNIKRRGHLAVGAVVRLRRGLSAKLYQPAAPAPAPPPPARRASSLSVRSVRAAASAGPETFVGRAERDLSRLRRTLQMDERSWQVLREGLACAMEGWGGERIPARPTGWLSDVSLNYAPIEYSVALEQRTGAAQLRFLTEAGAAEPTLEAHQRSAVAFARTIRARYPDSVDLGRLERIADLFLPAQGAQGSFAAWYSFYVGAAHRPEWKMYLNPRARGASAASSSAVVREALHRLGMVDAWDLLAPVVAGPDPEGRHGGRHSFVYFSLDLHAGPHARVKVYVEHRAATAPELAALLARVAPGSLSAAEVRDYCATMTGAGDGPYLARSPMTCFGLTRDARSGRLKVEAALYLPLFATAPHDAEISRRVTAYLSHGDAIAGPEERARILASYRGCVDAVAARRLDGARGLHAWMGLKGTRDRGKVVTFYLSAEMYEPLPVLPQKQ